jgi:C-terminal processing protease CtpA/Prc/Tol biopolymer transport system component
MAMNLVIASLFLAFAQSAPELTLPRHPSLSPDGNQIAFSHQGDIWVALVSDGRAQRLTAHDAYDGRPRWSPDGKTLAFVSNRHSNWDVFAIPAAGGQPQRMTWHSDGEKLHGWIDNERVLIGAQRDRRYSRRDNGAWVAYRDGRTPTILGDWAMKNPVISSDGSKLIYERGHSDPSRRAYRGAASSALWSYDFARDVHSEMTVFDGNDLQPAFGAHGKWIYFLSDRACKGNESGRDLGLWRMPLAGGEPVLVVHPGNNSLRNLSLSANTDKAVAELEMSIALIDLNTGELKELKVSGSIDGSMPRYVDKTISGGVDEYVVSADGESVAFITEGDLFVMRNHDDIKRAVRLTSHAAAESNPIFTNDDKTIMFISERDDNAEVYQLSIGDEQNFYTLRDPQLERLTETPVDESMMSLSPDGSKMAWVEGLGKFVVGDPESLVVQKTICDGFEAPSYDWSPDSRWITYSVPDDDFNVDVFVVNVHQEGATSINISKHPDDDTSPIWSPDGRKILFTSRRTMLDETDVWVAFLRAEDLERTKRERLEATERKEETDKESAEAEEKQAKLDAVLTGVWKGESAILDLRLRGAEVTGLYIMGDTKIELSKAVFDAEAKTFTYTVSEAGDTEHILNLEDDVLSNEQFSFERSEEDSQLPKEIIEPGSLVQIDFSGLESRIKKMTRREGNESAAGWAADSEKFYFNARLGTRLTSGTTADTGFFSSNIYDPKDSNVDGDNVHGLLHHDDDIYCVKKGQIYNGLKDGKKLPFNVSFRQDRMAVREAVVNQAWAVLDRMFYDPSFHGHDWRGSLDKWKPAAMLASTREDYGEMVNWMLGEMNASHMGYYYFGKSEAKETDAPAMGLLGVLWDDNYSGQGRRVAEVVSETPAARADSLLIEGDVVIAVNGVEYGDGDNWARLMSGTAGQETYLTVQGTNQELRSVTVRPASSINTALYHRYESISRARVESKSDNRLGYIHIESMSTAPLLEFQRKLFDAGDGKDCLLIDVRENGGGWTTDMILTMLTTRDHAFTIPRGGGVGYPQGRRVFATWTKPIVVLCNENSYSNAEIFSWSIKTLGRGPVVGKTTYGAVISTGGATMLDGSFVRMPFRGWYVNDENKTNMELNGCPPDYPVENRPSEYAKGEDSQLDKAIEVGLDLIK